MKKEKEATVVFVSIIGCLVILLLVLSGVFRT